MRKSCGTCIYSKNITLKDSIDGYIVDGNVVIDKSKCVDRDKVICVLKRSVHRKNREQRNCKDFDRR